MRIRNLKPNTTKPETTMLLGCTSLGAVSTGNVLKIVTRRLGTNPPPNVNGCRLVLLGPPDSTRIWNDAGWSTTIGVDGKVTRKFDAFSGSW